MLDGRGEERRHADALVLGGGENEVFVGRTELDAIDLLGVSRSRLQRAKTHTCDGRIASYGGPTDGRLRLRSLSEEDCSRYCWQRL